MGHLKACVIQVGPWPISDGLPCALRARGWEGPYSPSWTLYARSVLTQPQEFHVLFNPRPLHPQAPPLHLTQLPTSSTCQVFSCLQPLPVLLSLPEFPLLAPPSCPKLLVSLAEFGHLLQGTLRFLCALPRPSASRARTPTLSAAISCRRMRKHVNVRLTRTQLTPQGRDQGSHKVRAKAELGFGGGG